VEHEITNEMQYVIFSEEVKTYLADNNIQLNELLRKAGQNEISVVSDPAAPEGTREPVTILLGAAAVVAASTPILARLIESITNRPVIVKDYDLVPAADQKGHVLLRQSGDPILYWRERTRLIESKSRTTTEQKITAKAIGGIEIGFQHKSTS